MTIEADFGGWATKANVKCSDGLTILPGAFKHMHDKKVPLVYQHGHSNIQNVLGHAILESRDDGVYAYAFFNDTPQGNVAKGLVAHRDIQHLSIYANKLTKSGQNVVHGEIREVSLVLAGANPEAKIEWVNLRHDDGSLTELDDEAVIQTGLELEHALDEIEEGGELVHEDLTVNEVFNGMSEEEQNVVYYFVGVALEKAASEAAQSAITQPGEGEIAHQEGTDEMSRNVFDQTTNNGPSNEKTTLTHEDIEGIFADAMATGSLRKVAKNFALQHGVENIDVLFPDAKMATGVIELDKRRTEWVSVVLNGMRHTPFSRIKTLSADLTQEAARAKGYVKGAYKKEEWIGVTKRTTGPVTIYKKQQLDRDDILDVTDFDMVTFLKGEMRLMTEEEIARAVLIGDGRDISDEDKIKDPMGVQDGLGIRSILNDHEFYVTTINVNVDDANSSYDEVVDAVMDGMEFYKGTGTPTFFTTIPQLNKFLQAKDLNGQRYYKNRQEVADALGVDKIVTVEPMKEVAGLIGIIVNLMDFNVGTDRGGELTTFDDFDIDYNQYKYLMETRMSGALVRPKAAIVIRKTAATSVLVTPVKPAFNKTTGVVTIPTVTGVIYKNAAGTTLSAGAMSAIAAGETVRIYSVADTNYHFANNQEDSWPFTRDAA
jgi:HK97 family phage prohead protease